MGDVLDLPDELTLGDIDLFLFNEGTHTRLHHRLGAHPTEEGVVFRVWAPDAERITVIGSFNDWDRERNGMFPVGTSGIWEAFVEGAGVGDLYKYDIRSRFGGYRVDKADPFAAYAEQPPRTASVVWDTSYTWADDTWMAERGQRQQRDKPLSIYEVHLGSWRTVPEQGNRWLTYREIAPLLADHCEALGFTHVELLPITEHPFTLSWGYQTTGFFAPTSRYGTPQDFMAFVDHLHQRGIGVILDWVPAHFPSDEHGPGYFDGTHLFEHADPRRGFHPDWGSLIFNLGRNEVRAFLISSAMCWLERYHLDGLRVDAVASMLYLDYSRREGEWIPNQHGGREDLDAISFLQQANSAIYREFPDVVTIAEESTAWPMVSRPVDMGGLGFGFKWDMGWMHDSLSYLGRDPIHRGHHQREVTFRSLYVTSENYVLPLSHDEVVHGKGSLLGRMPGDRWQQLANLRVLLGWQWASPGKKLLFMGGEFGQEREWDVERSLDWHLLDDEGHAGIQRWVAHLNRLYTSEPCLHERDCVEEGIEWVIADDRDASVFALIRRDASGHPALVVANFTPVPRDGYRIGVPAAGHWELLANADDPAFGGGGYRHEVRAWDSEPTPAHGRDQSLLIDLAPLSVLVVGLAR